MGSLTKLGLFVVVLIGALFITIAAIDFRNENIANLNINYSLESDLVNNALLGDSRISKVSHFEKDIVDLVHILNNISYQDDKGLYISSYEGEYFLTVTQGRSTNTFKLK